MRRTALLFAVLASATLLGGCNNPNPSDDIRRNLEETKFAVTKVKQPLEIEGCLVTVHRVHTAASDNLQTFTLAVAKCPTATVTSVQHNCGKNCQSNNIVVEPGMQAIETTPAEIRRMAEKAKLREALRAELDRISARLDERENENSHP